MAIKKELVILAIIIFFSAFVRFYQLGYSHFYGDEIKTLYLRKDFSAFNFLMNQRKGPGQFLVSWLMEKVSGGYSEVAIRFPYALVGTSLVLMFYLFVRQNFGVTTAIFSTTLFSLNGFYIAFSRTAQYQVLYLFCGFLYLVLAKIHADKKKLSALVASATCFSLALLSHYDALFFLIPLFYIVGRRGFLKIATLGLLISSIFYIPNIYLGFFGTNTFGYISKRLTGENYLRNNSLYTMLVYNPFYLYLSVLSLLAGIAVIKVRHKFMTMLFAWAIVPFLTFQFFISNPGTHIHNYLIPVIILSGMGLNYLLDKFKRCSKFVVLPALTAIVFIYLAQLTVFVPAFNRGYPWKINRPNSNYHLFLYGFPYNRDWDKVGQYFASLEGVRNFYTNDNETVAEYYIKSAPYIAPGSNFLPQYYVQIDSPRELKQKPRLPLSEKYSVIFENGTNTTKIFRLKPDDVEITP